MIEKKICHFTTLYRSRSQNQDDFQAFIDNIEINLETLAQRNPFLTVVIGDFNAKLKNWCSKDSNNFEGITIENVTSQFGLSQIIKEATHFLEILFSQRSLTWWLNLVFTHLCIQIVTIRLYSQNLIYKYITHHHTHEESGTINKQMLILSDGPLLTLIGKGSFSILMLTRKFLSSAGLFVAIKIPDGLIKQSKLSFKKKRHIHKIMQKQK